MGIVRTHWLGALLVASLGSYGFAASDGAVPRQDVRNAPPVPGQNVPGQPDTAAEKAARAKAVAAIGEAYVPPPRQLKKVGDHWTPYDPPAVPEGTEAHVIVAGETLWGLASSSYGDPYLWPIIWDANRWVTYSHWIYPGDPLVIPPRPTVITEAGPEPVPEPAPAPAPEPAPAPAPAPAAPTGPALFPAADAQQLACTAQLLEEFDPAPLTISGRERVEREMQAQGDIVYLSAGRDMQIRPGAEYVVVRPDGVINHPDTRKPAAVYVRRLGRVRVISVQPSRATTEVTLSCDAIQQGDFLVPYREMPMPMIERVPLSKLATPNPGRRVGAVIVMGDRNNTIAGTGEVVGIDLSSHAGVTAGDRVVFWKKVGEDAPREVFAQGVVLSTNGGGSMVKILEATNEVEPGDRAEVL